MIAYNHRFHGLGSLKYVYAQGKTVRSTLMALKFADNPRRRQYRVAVVVSKKVSKSAVVRNRIRRRVYEIVRQNDSQINRPVDLVFTIYAIEAATLPAAELEALVLDLLNQAKITSAN